MELFCKSDNTVRLWGNDITESLKNYAPQGSEKIFLDFLAFPPQNANELVDRQNLFRFFQSSPETLRCLTTLLLKISDIKKEYIDFKKRNSGISQKSEVYTECINEIAILQMAATFSRKLIMLLREAYKTVAIFDTLPESLKKTSEEIAKLCFGDNADQLVALATEFKFSSLDCLDFELNIECDDTGKAYQMSLTSLNTNYFDRSWSPFKKKNSCLNNVVHSINGNTNIYEILLVSLKRLTRTFEWYLNYIFDQTAPLIKDLKIISICEQYIDMISDYGIVIYPTIGRNICFTELYDLSLIFARKSIKGIVPNDFLMKENSSTIFIYGDNSRGKTTLLRSVASAIVLSSAGLPIIASSGELSIVTGLYFVFAGAEIFNPMGRFENEAKSLAEVLKHASDGSIVFLNELFQSTSYREASDALKNIIDYMYKKGIRTIIVTHLRELLSENFRDAIYYVPDEQKQYRFVMRFNDSAI